MAIFVGCCVLIYAYGSRTVVMTSLLAATGVIAPQMLSFWREKVRTETVLILAGRLPSGELMQIIQLLLANPAR